MGVRRMWSAALEEPIPGGASWAYVFGSVCLALFVLQAVTGFVLASYYSPSTTQAWASIAYLEREVSGGALLRGLHHFGASAMVCAVVLHGLQVLLFGAYRAPRELNWWSGLGLLGLVLAFALTGYLLPWDQTGYWATKVATSIAGTVPLVGDWIQRLLLGGRDYGTLTLTRFYALHVILLPAGTGVLILGHLWLFRRHGVTSSPRRTADDLRRFDMFWPRQLAFDVIAILGAIGLVWALAYFWGAPLQAPADPSVHFVARPEWYFLFLFQLLKYFKGSAQLVGTVVLPTVAVLAALSVPLIDRAGRPGARRGVLAMGAAAVLLVAGLTVQAMWADRQDRSLQDQTARARWSSARARRLAASGVPVAGPAHMLRQDPLVRGSRLFAQECLGCHPVNGQYVEDPRGPDLSGYASRAWVRAVITHASDPRLFGRTRLDEMPDFRKLPADELEALTDFVYAQRLAEPPSPEDPRFEPLLSKHECLNCHEFEAFDALDGPALYRYQSQAWVRAVIAHPDAEHLYGELCDMPAFEAQLRDQDLDALVAFVLDLATSSPRTAWPFRGAPTEAASSPR